MAWDPPSAFTAGAVLTAAQMNQVRNSLRYLKGLDGAVTLSDALIATMLESNSVGRMKVWATPSGSPLTTSAQVVVPDGSGDATQGAMFVGVARSASAAVAESFVMGAATGTTKSWTTSIATTLKDIVLDVQSSGEVRIYLANSPTANAHIVLACLWR